MENDSSTNQLEVSEALSIKVPSATVAKYVPTTATDNNEGAAQRPSSFFKVVTYGSPCKHDCNKSIMTQP